MMLDRPITCPCCGQAIAATHAPIDALATARLSQTEKKIVMHLASIYPRATDMSGLIEAAYWDDPNGGPLEARQVVHVMLVRIRRKLPKYGWTIPRVLSGPGSHSAYRLEPIA